MSCDVEGREGSGSRYWVDWKDWFLHSAMAIVHRGRIFRQRQHDTRYPPLQFHCQRCVHKRLKRCKGHLSITTMAAIYLMDHKPPLSTLHEDMPDPRWDNNLSNLGSSIYMIAALFQPEIPPFFASLGNHLGCLETVSLRYTYKPHLITGDGPSG